MKFDSLIFDLDGTLWDSSDMVVKAWNQVLTKYGKQMTKADIQGIMGMQMKEITEKLFPDLDQEDAFALFHECGKHENVLLACEGGKLYTGLRETLKTLSENYPLFIVSNCQLGYIESFLTAHRFHEMIKDTECAGRTGCSKGENIRLIIQRNRLTAPVYVGDTEIDRMAAEQAGVPFIYAAYGFGKVNNYDDIIHSPGDLLRLLDS